MPRGDGLIPAKPGERPAGRKKGTPNKTTTLLKEAILMAAEQAGGRDGIAGYLRIQAATNPGPFMSLLGKVLPMQITGENGEGSGALVVTWGGPAPKASDADD
jgi:hypothetical protein